MITGPHAAIVKDSLPRELIVKRCQSMFKMTFVGMALTIANVCIAFLNPGSTRAFNDLGVGTGIFISLVLSAVFARKEKFSQALFAASFGMLLSIVIGDVLHGEFTERLLYILIAVIIPGYGLDQKLLLRFYGMTVGVLALTVIFMPGGIHFGVAGFQTLIFDIVIILTAVIAFFFYNIGETRQALNELLIRQQEAQHQKSVAELAAREAKVANNSKSMFLANVSHELRTPLNAILGYVELIQEESEEEPWFDQELGRVHQASTQLLQLINDVLDLSKMEAGRLEIIAIEFKIDELLEELTKIIDPLAKGNQNTFIIEIEDGLVDTLYTDRLRVRQVLLNLLSNAVKFTRHGHIWLRVQSCSGRHEHGDWIEFSVQDTGIGMTSEQQAKIFEPFLQATAETTHTYGGTGLGLALSRRICHMLQGQIHVESEVGQGSVFYMEIPQHLDNSKAKRSEGSNP